MAAGAMAIDFSNGQKLTLYWAGSDPVTAILPVNMNGVAGATSPKTFTVLSDCSISDITCSAGNVSGEFEFIADGRRTGMKIPTDQRWLMGQANRDNYIPANYSFRRGVTYMAMQTIVQT
jgi:hypothetical protein